MANPLLLTSPISLRGILRLTSLQHRFVGRLRIELRVRSNFIRWWRSIFNARVSNGIAVPCMTTDVSAIKNTMWKIVSACWIPANYGKRGQDNRHGPTEPRPGHKRLLSNGIGEKASAAWTLTGRATKIRKREIRRPTQAIGTSRAGNTCSPSIKNMVTCISQASPS